MSNNEDRQSAHSDSHVIRITNSNNNHHNYNYHHYQTSKSINKNNDSSSLSSNQHHSQHQHGQSVTLLLNNNHSNSSSNNTITTTTQTTATNKSSSTANMMNNNNNNVNKKHNIGFRLRRLFFGSNPNLPSISRSKSTATTTTTIKDSEVGENKNFIKHNPSLHSNSSESSSNNEHKSDPLRRKRTAQFSNRKTDVINWHSNNNNNNSNNNNGNVASLSSSIFSANQNSYECSICLLEQPLFQFPELKTCNHRACINCLRQYLRIEIYESRINITCLQCQELMHPNDIKAILKNDNVLIEKYESFMVRRTLITDPDARWCPAPDCDYCVIATGCASCPMLKCERPGCETLFCYHCKQEWHPNQTCDQARAQRGLNSKSVFISSSNPTKSNVTFTSSRGPDFSQAHASTSIDSFVQRDDIKPCPCCKVLIIKMNDGSCNHMTCSVCGTEFCWLCMQKISDLHYLSPSGCTFWGKKPWSRKKKIMWQLGMLVGAPVGIALIAGIAVPAIIIGIPVWVGRKLYSRFERNHMSRHKSNFLVTAGVMTSIFVSPILAAVAVGIGVPILLAYVYGVVPISLCRSSGCGVSTSSSGVRIELDEDEITAPDGVSVDTALSGRAVTNPSIGEVSLGMSASLSIGSSSHLDRVVLDIQPDRESSSIAACAGSITSNYINNNNNNNSQIHAQIIGQKLETLADINSNNSSNNHNNNKRFSLTSQNADSSSVTLSFGDRSVNTNPSLIDEASSLKAHTGSLLEAQINSFNNNNNTNYQQSSPGWPVEVHVINDDIDSATNTIVSDDKDNDNNHCSKSVPVNFLLNKFESRSMEYLSNNYCNICHKSHKPCCPNFQHPNTKNSNSKSIKICKKSSMTTPETASAATNSITKKALDDNNNDNDHQSEDNKSNNDKLEINESVQLQKSERSEKQKQSSKYEKNFEYFQYHTIDSGSSPTTTTFLTKKAMSQIFYPNNYGKDGSTIITMDDCNDNKNSSSNNNDDNNNVETKKIIKSSLSHSLSFSTYNNHNNSSNY